MPFFAEPSEQNTTGPRGKTTRRKGTKTVRGPEGAYCAEVKEELLAREPVPVFVAMYRAEYTSGIVYSGELFRCPTRELAVERLAEYQARAARWTNPECTTTHTIVPAMMRWEMVNGQVREVITPIAAEVTA